jgi:eukaryotic-like serine/threonine-protein kinase
LLEPRLSGGPRPWLLALALCAGCASAGPGPRAPDRDAAEPPADVASDERAPAVDADIDAFIDVASDGPEPGDRPAPAPPGDGGADGGMTVGPAFENSLGMRFVVVPKTSVWFSIWETRVQDYEAYARATGASVPRPDFPEGPLQPKAAVSRAEARSFADWLTRKERSEGRLGPTQRYRLPSDAEWDAASEVGQTGGPFPWGSGFPPPAHFANYGLSADGFRYTAPVGSFAPNRLGLHDLAGNLWEWIDEGCASGGGYLVRGAGWNAQHQAFLMASFHYCFGADLIGHHNVGFRLVLERGGP